MVRRVCFASVENTPRWTVMMRAISSRSLFLRSTTIWRSRAKGTNATERAGIGSTSPSPMNRPAENTLTGPLSSTESVGLRSRIALNGKDASPCRLSGSKR